MSPKVSAKKSVVSKKSEKPQRQSVKKVDIPEPVEVEEILIEPISPRRQIAEKASRKKSVQKIADPESPQRAPGRPKSVKKVENPEKPSRSKTPVVKPASKPSKPAKVPQPVEAKQLRTRQTSAPKAEKMIKEKAPKEKPSKEKP